MTILPGYAKQYKPKSLTSPILLLSNLYDETLKTVTNKLLMKNVMRFLEKLKYLKNKYLLSIQNRLGRVTASVMKDVCRTSLETPNLV